jgi:hypothetical protein
MSSRLERPFSWHASAANYAGLYDGCKRMASSLFLSWRKRVGNETHLRFPGKNKSESY